MEKVIPVIINGEAQLIDEAELRNICALENIPYDSPPPSVNPQNTVEPTFPLPKEVHSESVQVSGPPPLSIVNSSPLTLLQTGELITVPISSHGISSVGDTILVSRPEEIEVLSANSTDVIYTTEELHIDPSQTVTEMIKLVAPSGQKEDLVIADESNIVENGENLSLQSEYTPVSGLQGIGSAKIILNSKSSLPEICELIFHYKGVGHRVIVPFPENQTDFSEITQNTRHLFGDIDKQLVGVIKDRKLVACSDNQQIHASPSSDMGLVASLDTPESEEVEGATVTRMVQTPTGLAQAAAQVAQHIQVAQPQNIYVRATTGPPSLVSTSPMIVRPATNALLVPTSPVTLGHSMTTALLLPPQNVVTTVGGQVVQVASLGTDNKVVVQMPNQSILAKPETTKMSEDVQKTVSNGIKDKTGGGKPEDKNQLVEVSCAHCENCGHNSRDLKVCQKCRRPLPKDAKITLQKIMPTAVSFSRNPEGYCLSVRCDSCNLISTDLKNCYHCKSRISEDATRSYVRLGSKELLKLETPKKKKCQRKKKVEEPVTLSLLSSDEEEGEQVGPKKVKLRIVVDKEPIITNETTSPCVLERIEGGGLDLADIITSPDVERALLQCRTVRIGSYKTVPEGKVAITEYGLYIKIPALETKEMVTVKIFKNEIVKILGNFGKTVPVLFYYTTANAAEKIRRILQMSPPEQHRGPYYDPTSSVEMHRRITLLPEKISEETRLFLKCTYDSQCLLENLSTDEANSILIKASPSEAPVDSQPAIQTPARGKENFMQPPGPNSTPVASNAPIQAIMVYPPPPAKGGISINTEDYGCLGEDNFLNDVIIDFYLKYFVQTQLSPEDQQRTHVFSSFFYKRLTTKTPPRPDDKQSPAERRHTRVRSWTKHVDLFSKDFIIIPINENSHWFLGVVCFPGLTNAVRMTDGKVVPNPSKRRDTGVPQMIGGTTITRINQEPMTITIEPDEEDRDEADADDDDLEPNTSDDEPCEEPEEGSELLDDATHPVPKPKLKKEPQDPIKQPCILIFDSLAGASRSKVCATLREYLQVEYNVRHRSSRGKREINKFTMRASVVKVPQQTNYTDCGLYVLQYTEAFFQSPITDYRMPIKQLVDWFDTTIVSKKRYQIQQLLHKLMEEQNVDTSRLNLPMLNLHPEGTGKVFHDDEEEMPEDMEDMDYDDMEDEEEMMGEEEEDEEMSEYHRKLVVNAPMSGSSPMTGNTAVPSGNSQASSGEDLRARIQRRELTISSSIANSIGSSVSITTSTSTTAPSPVKAVTLPAPTTPVIPPTISLSRKVVSESSPTKTSQLSSHGKYEHLSITSTTVGSPGAKRKITSVSLKDVRNPRLSQSPATPNRSVDIKKVRTD